MVGDVCTKSQPLELNKVPALEKIVYLVYADDSGSTGKNLVDKESPFQVLCAVVIDDLSFRMSEAALGVFTLISHSFSENIPESSEFHAYDLFRGEGRF